MAEQKVRVLELFSGVGGFRIGLNAANEEIGSNTFEVVWSNQWEPDEKAQHASRVYVARFGDRGHSNKDIATVLPEEIPEADLIVGGFPCQDYSVARTLNQATGIEGKKGVLWWEIHKIVKAKRPRLILLENVDRLLKSPADHRGRDFAIMLRTLNDLGYVVEWRVINAADFGFPQRRRRVFILAYESTTRVAGRLRTWNPLSWILQDGVFGTAFPCELIEPGPTLLPAFVLDSDPVTITERFGSSGGTSPFYSAGVAVDGRVYSYRVHARFEGKRLLLRDILEADESRWKSYRIPNRDVKKWKFLKDAKRLERVKRSGVRYAYVEGAIPFPDPTDRPSRTIVTGEGGRTPSRFKHVVKCRNGYRRLTPIELERLNGFPDDHTNVPGISESRRAFFMGNALVTGVVTSIAVAVANLGVLRGLGEPFRDNVENPRPRQPVDGAADGRPLPEEENNRLAPT